MISYGHYMQKNETDDGNAVNADYPDNAAKN
jgi:hypothetical protein